MTAKVVIYTTANCHYCIRAKQLLDRKKISYAEIRVDLDEAKRKEMIERSGRKTVPQIFINDQAIGGCDDLYALEQTGKLSSLL